MTAEIFRKAVGNTCSLSLLGDSTAEQMWGVVGTEDEDEVMSLVYANVPKSWFGLKLRAYQITDHCNGCWDVAASYSRPSQLTRFNFDTTGGTQKIFQSFGTSTYDVSGENLETHIDFQNGIGYDGQRFQGVDISIPAFHFTLQRSLPAPLPQEFFEALATHVGKVNSTAITLNISGNTKTLRPGELLYEGVTGNLNGTQDDGDWDLTCKFAVSLNNSIDDETELTIGSGDDEIENIEKEGFDYLWVLYEQAKSGGITISIPSQVQVEQVYNRADLSILFTGVPASEEETSAQELIFGDGDPEQGE